MSLEALSFTESITEPDMLASIAALPTEDDLPYDDGAPKETAVHRDQMWTLMYSLQMYWADRPRNYVSGNMFLYYATRRRSRAAPRKIPTAVWQIRLKKSGPPPGGVGS